MQSYSLLISSYYDLKCLDQRHHFARWKHCRQWRFETSLSSLQELHCGSRWRAAVARSWTVFWRSVILYFLCKRVVRPPESRRSEKSDFERTSQSGSISCHRSLVEFGRLCQRVSMRAWTNESTWQMYSVVVGRFRQASIFFFFFFF